MQPQPPTASQGTTPMQPLSVIELTPSVQQATSLAQTTSLQQSTSLQQPTYPQQVPRARATPQRTMLSQPPMTFQRARAMQMNSRVPRPMRMSGPVSMLVPVRMASPVPMIFPTQIPVPMSMMVPMQTVPVPMMISMLVPMPIPVPMRAPVPRQSFPYVAQGSNIAFWTSPSVPWQNSVGGRRPEPSEARVNSLQLPTVRKPPTQAISNGDAGSKQLLTTSSSQSIPRPRSPSCYIITDEMMQDLEDRLMAIMEDENDGATFGSETNPTEIEISPGPSLVRRVGSTTEPELTDFGFTWLDSSRIFMDLLPFL